MSLYTVNTQDTIVALATPPGVGAIGVIRVSGLKAIPIVDQVFKGKKLIQQPSHTVHFGSIVTPEGQILDEVLATLFIAPRSYTGENTVEISCHGSNFILQSIIQLLIQQGARLAQPGEFTLRAFLNGKIDLSQAEAVADLIASSSAASHQLAIQQMRGGFSHEIQVLRQELIDFASLLELELDFSEEDVEFANRQELENLLTRTQSLIKNLIQSFQLGNVMKTGVQTVIAGRPNAGKSTLLNALLNEERAIVSDIAGTTRDTIEEVLNINGINFRIIDTAGIREAQDQIEAIGVAKTLEKIEQAALLIYVFDVIRTQPQDVRADLQRLLTKNMHVLLVANKMDLNPYTTYEDYFPEEEKENERDEAQIPKSTNHTQSPKPTLEISKSTNLQISKSSWVPVSAIHQMNIEYLKEKLFEAVTEEKVVEGSTIVSNARHYEALQRAYDNLDAALNGLTTGVTSDFVAMDIRQALHYLGEITGEVTTDDLLGNIFGRFCIGK